MPKNEQFGKALQAVRAAVALSQPQFAKWLEIDVGRIRDWEQSHTLPNFESFTTLLRRLGPHADYLLRALAIQPEIQEGSRTNENLPPSPEASVEIQQTRAQLREGVKQKRR